MSSESKEEKEEILENPPELKGVYDLSMLVYLKMYHVLVNLRARYSEMKRKHPYTSVSTVLIAINPYEKLPIYGPEVIEEFHEKQQEFRAVKGKPHPYGVSARAYMRMVHRGIAQSVIVCGESGAGKSETAKLIMRYLAVTSQSSDGGTSIIEQQIIAASPILEAFGNAKTVLNNNSSRFGKFTKLLYERKGHQLDAIILGAFLETYLLEKSRVVFQARNERNYHVFYFFYSGKDEDYREKFGINQLEDFFYTNQGKCTTVPGISDKARFEELQSSLKIMRVNENDQVLLWQLVGAILHLGNIKFRKDDSDFAEVDEKVSGDHLQLCADMFSVDLKALIKRLTVKGMKVRGKTILKNINYQDARANADAIAKATFENAFLWLGKRINSELYQTDVDDGENLTFIGILDVFGFENFKKNSLEQLCINFTNEKLQQFFNEAIIKSEQEEYINESVFWTPLDVPDNEECIRLLEDKAKGLFRLMDDQIRNRPKTEALFEFLFKNWGKNKALSRARAPKRKKGKKSTKYYGVTLKHFAEPVTYQLDLFLSKNADAIHPDTQKMFKKSKNELAKEIGGKSWGIGGGKKKKAKFTSVVSVFHKGITTLMKNLKMTEPYFVRCVNPNKKKSSKEWNPALVEKQLRCGGLLEALQVLTLGYPTRVPYDTLYEKFHGVIDNPLIKNLGSSAFAEAILIAWQVTKADFELGLTKIFFKPAKAAILDEIMDQAGKPLTKMQNDRITKWVVGKRVRQFVGSIKAMCRVVLLVKNLRAQENWNQWGRMISYVALTWVRNLRTARSNILKRKRREAATVIQSYWKASSEIVKVRKQVEDKKEATALIWQTFQLYKQRQEFHHWLTKTIEETREIKRQLEEKRRREEEELRRQLEEKRRKEEEELRRKEAEERERLRIIAEENRKRLMQEEESRLLRERQMEEERIRREKAAEETRLLNEKLEREARERERLLKEQQEREARAREEAEREKKRKDAEKKRLEEEAERKRREDDERKRREEEQRRVEEERIKQEEAIARGKQMAKKKEAEDEEIARTERKKKKKEDVQGNRQKKKKQKASHLEKMRDIDQRAKEEREFTNVKNILVESYMPQPEDEIDEEYDSATDESDDSEHDINVDFHRAASVGQLFLKHTGKRRRKPQDRFVKVTFDQDGEPRNISWGSGSRHINFEDICTITWGHWTPVFTERKETLNPNLCFSVIGREQILDLQAPEREVAELWVLGLRALKELDNDESDRIAQEMKSNGTMPGLRKRRKEDKPSKRTTRREKRTKSLMMLQQDLFVMTCTTVFRNIEEEGQYVITPAIRDKFDAKVMYDEALQQDIPWRQWNTWVRQRIMDHLKNYNDTSEEVQSLDEDDDKCSVM